MIGKETDKFEVFLSKGKLTLESKEKYNFLFEENQSILRAKVLAENDEEGGEESQA